MATIETRRPRQRAQVRGRRQRPHHAGAGLGRLGDSVVVGILIALGIVAPKDVQHATLVGTVLGYLFGEAKQGLSY